MRKLFTLIFNLSMIWVTFSVYATDEPNHASDLSIFGNKGQVRIFLVRHGKTMFNTTGQVQGWSDTPLTKQGIEEAKDLAVGLADISFTKAFSSDLGRAISTANYILSQGDRHGLTLITLPELREWNYGGYEGRDNAIMWDPIFREFGLTFDNSWSQYSELEKHLSDEDIMNRIARNDPTATAESYDEIKTRTYQAIVQIVRQTLAAGGGNALAVSHGSEIKTILHVILPEQQHKGNIANCSVTILIWQDGQFFVKSIGELSYLNYGKQWRVKD